VPSLVADSLVTKDDEASVDTIVSDGDVALVTA
jgi:hypothetical protein